MRRQMRTMLLGLALFVPHLVWAQTFTVDVYPVDRVEPKSISPCGPRVLEYDVSVTSPSPVTLSLHVGSTEFRNNSFQPRALDAGRHLSRLTISLDCIASRPYTREYTLHVRATTAANRMAGDDTKLYVTNVAVAANPANLSVRRATRNTVQVAVSPSPGNYPPIPGTTELKYDLRSLDRGLCTTGASFSETGFRPAAFARTSGTSQFSFMAPSAVGPFCLRFWAFYGTHPSNAYASPFGVVEVSDLPRPTTAAARDVTYTTATLDGAVEPRYADTLTRFEWGTTTQYGNQTASLSVPKTELKGVSVTRSMVGLVPGTQYHYRLVAENKWGRVVGADRTFTTLVAVPEVSVEPSQLSFGPTPIRTAAPTQVLTITSRGTSDLSVAAVLTSGGAFSVGGGTCGALPRRLAPGESCQLEVGFLPQIEGPLTGALTIVSDAARNPQLDVPLAGRARFGALRNLALAREVYQSSCNFGTTGAEAIDGNTSGNFADGSVTHTQWEERAYWQVDLGDVQSVEQVHVYNRTNCCSERLTNFEVGISQDGSNWERIQVPGQGGSPSTVDFAGRVARYVRVQLVGGNYLSLAEVEVMGSGPVGKNVALGAAATQSSDAAGTDGSRAVDGSTSGNASDDSLTQTQVEPQPWWTVDLGYRYRIHGVRIWNRTDCCAETLSDFDVALSEDGVTWETINVPEAAGRPTTVPIDDRLARYVRVQLRGAGALSLSEVEVMGVGPVEESVALGRPASQSSDNFGTNGSQAVDGNTSGRFADGSVTHTHPDPQAWWMVDLEAPQLVKEVRVYNRTDCCTERLRDFDVSVSEDGIGWTGVHVPDVGGRPTTVDFAEAPARYVKIQLRGTNFLALAEVEVIAKMP